MLLSMDHHIVQLRAPYGASHFEGEGCETSILVVLNYRIKICEPPQTNVMCAGPQGSDPLTISDKVPGIFRIKEISISPTDPPILLFRVDFDLCHHGGEADKREILCWPAFPNMSRLLTLALCTLHIAHRDWGLGSVGSAAFHWRFAQICAARYRLDAPWHISSAYMCWLTEGLAPIIRSITARTRKVPQSTLPSADLGGAADQRGKYCWQEVVEKYLSSKPPSWLELDTAFFSGAHEFFLGSCMFA